MRPRRCFGAPALWAPLAGISSKAPCSRRTSIVAARVTPTGQRWCSFTTRCRRSPVVAINRVLAIAELQGASSALEAMQEVAADVRLAEYQPYWAARAELLAKTGANGEARRAYEIAIALERDAAVRRFLQRRQSALPA